MTHFFQEDWNTIQYEAAGLIETHYKEVAHYQDIKLNPDHETYRALEKNGALKVFVARDESHELLGYAVFFIRLNLHYKTSLQALQDIIFINPKHRGFGKAFINWCDEQLKKHGVQVVYQHVKKSHNFGPMLESLGYQEIDLIFGKRLDKGE